MSDPNKRPDGAPDTNPAHQADEAKGTIKGPQRTDHNTQVVDTPRGSEVETRNSSNNRG